MKKILYIITQAEHGGAQAYVRDLAFYFKKEYEVVIAAGEPQKSQWLKKEASKKMIKFCGLQYLKREVSPINDFRAVREIRKLIKKELPGIIHLNSSKASILGSMAAKGLSGTYYKKIVYTAHGWIFNEPLPAAKKKLYVYLEKKYSENKDMVICVSKNDLAAAEKENIADKNRLAIIHNGRSINFQLSRQEARREISSISGTDADEARIIIGVIANLYKTKGLEYLVQAAKILVDNKINIKAFILGGGPEKKELENWIRQLRLKNNVCLLGPVPNAARLLKAFDIYVCPSIKEGLSFTLIEAMQSGLPIVAADTGGNKELIINNECGLLVQPARPEELARAISRLANDPEMSAKLAVKAKKRALGHFSQEQMLKKTEEVYNSLL